MLEQHALRSLCIVMLVSIVLSFLKYVHMHVYHTVLTISTTCLLEWPACAVLWLVRRRNWCLYWLLLIAIYCGCCYMYCMFVRQWGLWGAWGQIIFIVFQITHMQAHAKNHLDVCYMPLVYCMLALQLMFVSTLHFKNGSKRPSKSSLNREERLWHRRVQARTRHAVESAEQKKWC